MKKYMVISIVLCGLLAFGSSAWSLTINGTTDVGIADTLLGSSALPNSGAATELAWVQTFFPGETVNVTTTTTAVDWTETSLAGTYAFKLSDDPADFFIKIGTGNTGSDVDHFMFQNNIETGWAVIALSDLNINNIENFDVGRISHVGEVGGGTQVPEPSMLLLFGSGLLGLGLFGRKKFRK